MSEFTPSNWQDALSNLYTRASEDSVFRALCLTDPKAAVAQVSDIELPDWFKFDFAEKHHDLTYSYFLPPALGAASPSADTVKKLIDWNVYCTDPWTY